MLLKHFEMVKWYVHFISSNLNLSSCTKSFVLNILQMCKPRNQFDTFYFFGSSWEGHSLMTSFGVFINDVTWLGVCLHYPTGKQNGNCCVKNGKVIYSFNLPWGSETQMRLDLNGQKEVGLQISWILNGIWKPHVNSGLKYSDFECSGF